MLPSDGATDVPVDVQPRAWVVIDPSAGSCHDGFQYPTLSLLKSGIEVPAKNVETYANANIFEVEPTQPLEPNTVYTLRLVDEGTGQVAETSFTTGTMPSGTTPATAEPLLEIVELRERTGEGDSDTHRYYVDYRITPGAADPSGLSLVRAEYREQPQGLFAFGEATPFEGRASITASEGDDICLTPVQESANGAEIIGDAACITAPVGSEHGLGGCRAVGSGRVNGGDPLLGLLAGWLARRRRSKVRQPSRHPSG
jgi:hypothetical protein